MQLTLRMEMRLPDEKSPARRLACVGSSSTLSCSVSCPASPASTLLRLMGT